MRVDRPRLRRFRPSDLEAILAVEHASFRRDAYPGGLFLHYWQLGAIFLVALDGGTITGYAVATVNVRRAELVSIAVAPDARGTGTGGALLASIIRRCRRARVPRLSLTVKVTNRRAQKFYTAFGFRRVRRVPAYYEDGRDGYRMALDLRYHA